MLRSANFGELFDPRTRGKCYGPCTLRVAAPSVWNNLPPHLRNDDISREQFTRDLKNISVRTCLLVRGAFENVCLKARFINGLTYLLTDLHWSYLLTSINCEMYSSVHHTESEITTEKWSSNLECERRRRTVLEPLRDLHKHTATIKITFHNTSHFSITQHCFTMQLSLSNIQQFASLYTKAWEGIRNKTIKT